MENLALSKTCLGLDKKDWARISNMIKFTFRNKYRYYNNNNIPQRKSLISSRQIAKTKQHIYQLNSTRKYGYFK